MFMKYLFLIFSLFLFSCNAPVQDTNQNNETQTTQKEVILALWDSLTAWYGLEESENYPSKLQKKLDDAGYNYEVINAWVSWDTSANILSRASLYLEKNPSIVILVVWWNDGLRSLSTVDLQQNILKIIDTFPDAQIVLGWMDIPVNLWISYRNDFKKVYADIAKEREDIYFMEFFLEWVWGKKEYNISDMIHPNSQWYDIIVANLVQFLEKNNVIIK